MNIINLLETGLHRQYFEEVIKMHIDNKKQQGIQQKAVAESLDVTSTALTNYKNGNRYPDCNKVADLLKKIGRDSTEIDYYKTVRLNGLGMKNVDLQRNDILSILTSNKLSTYKAYIDLGYAGLTAQEIKAKYGQETLSDLLLLREKNYIVQEGDVFKATVTRPHYTGSMVSNMMVALANQDLAEKLRDLRESLTMYNTVKVRQRDIVTAMNQVKPLFVKINEIFNSLESDYIESGETDGVLITVLNHLTGLKKCNKGDIDENS